MKNLYIFSVVFLLGVSGLSFAEEQKAAEPCADMNVLFVGNSYTYFNDMPGMLADMVDAVRKNEVSVRKLEVDRVLAGGADLQSHWEKQDRQLITKLDHQLIDDKFVPVKRDYVVLQEQSLGALKPARRERMFRYAKLICDEAKAKGTDAVFFMTWGRRVTFNPDASGKMADRQYMYEEMRDGESVVVDPKVISANDGIAMAYRKIAAELGAKVAPCGIAFARAIKQGIVVHRESEKDGSHPNLAGSYLAACVFYGTIYDRNPEEIPDDTCKGIEQTLAARLQTIANQAVMEEKQLLKQPSKVAIKRG